MIGEYELDGCCSSKPKRSAKEDGKKDANENVVLLPTTQAVSQASPNLFALEPYSLTYPRMGRCIIVNQKFFAPSTNLDTRLGTDEDVRSLAWSFTRLHFQVDVVHNRTVAELRSVIRELSTFDHSRYASFVLCLLSHGERGFVFGHDGKLLLQEVLDAFQPSRCPSLKGKPKLFILQACRGNYEDEGVPVKDEPDNRDKNKNAGQQQQQQQQQQQKQDKAKDQVDANGDIPSVGTPTIHEDSVLACAAADGYVAYRDASTGTPFIQRLCRVLDSSDVSTAHILDILTRVSRALSVEFGNATCTKQTATVFSNMSKLFFLKPKAQATT